ncbi:MAG: hypothetical protein O2894_07535 [Planctomycetota bacterium]|nr:hypothetical protein [Planctomycetota bacterium]
MRALIASLVLATGLVALAPLARAGERIVGSGWELTAPDGYVETLSMEGGGRFNVTSRFGTLPIKGVPEIKAYVAGDSSDPTGVLVVSRIDLSKSVTTAQGLGVDEAEAMRAQFPASFTVSATRVGAYEAVEASFPLDGIDDGNMSRTLVIACGDYVVAVMLITREELPGAAESTWASVKSSIKIDPPMNKWLLFGLIGLGALGAMWLLGRVGTRQAREIPEHAGRWHRFEEGPASSRGVGVGAAPIKTGVRPQVLPSSRARFEDGPPGQGASGRPRRPEAAPARPASSSAAAPTPHDAPTARAGLRTTRPASGQWGK